MATTEIFPAEELPDLELERVIGRTDETIEGAEVPTGDFRLQITGYYLPDSVTLAYAYTLQRLIRGSRGTGSYNGIPYLGAAVGEVQLRSATGGGRVVDIIPITFEFDITPNIENQPDAGFTNLTMLGHDLLDYRFKHAFDANNSKKIIVAPKSRIVHRVHSPENYNLTLLPV